jgi:hypothetical protein
MDWLPPRLVEWREAALAAAREQYTGITAEGHPVSDLFPLHQTGLPTQPITAAAEAYLATLDGTQRERGQLAIDAPDWMTWSNISPFLMRHGLLLDDLSEQQRAAAMRVVEQSLSAGGFKTARNVMRLNYHLGELTGSWEEYGEWVYFMTIFGTPSPREPWGWQLDGHHCNLNCFVLGDQMVLTPAFLGSEPVYAESGSFAGTRVFEPEERAGLELMHALSAHQQARAMVADRFHPREDHIQGGAQRDNQLLPYEGIRFTELAPDQREKLISLVEVYAGRLRSGHDRIKMEEVRQHLADTYLVWYGGTSDDSVFYYRVHSPVVLIEFDHQCGIVFDNDTPARIHVHTVVRTPNGNDYGKDLLRQHYEQFHR